VRRKDWGERLQFGAYVDWAAFADWIFFADGANFFAGLWIDLDGAYWDGSRDGIWAEVPDEFQGYAFAAGVKDEKRCHLNSTIEDCIPSVS
jgi:hypothetical protein